MLKRVAHIFLILLLVFSTTGLTITRHYCGRNLVNTSIYSSPHNCCEGKCPGCHNERINIRITDKFETSQPQADFKAGFKNLLKHHSLPTILAFSFAPNIALLNDASGDHSIKPSPTKLVCAGLSTATLQVFLF